MDLDKIVKLLTTDFNQTIRIIDNEFGRAKGNTEIGISANWYGRNAIFSFSMNDLNSYKLGIEPLSEWRFKIKTTCECLVCKKILEIEGDDRNSTIPMVYSGIACRADGNYGSTIFDPIDKQEFLRFFICDECLKERAGLVEHFEVKHKVETCTITKFNAIIEAEERDHPQE